MKTKIAIYYVIVIFANIIAATVLSEHLNITIVSFLVIIPILIYMLELTKLGRSLVRLDEMIHSLKYTRHSGDPTDTNGKFTYDKEAIDSMFEEKDERERTILKNVRLGYLIVLPLFIIPFLFFGDFVKCLLMVALFFLATATINLLNRKLNKEITDEQRANEEAMKKELEEQKKREELGKWK